MAVAVQCPGCGSRLGVPNTAAGKLVKCPKCAITLSIPGGSDFEVAENDFEVVEDDFEVLEEKPKSRLAATRIPRSGTRDDDDDRPRRKRNVVANYEDEDDDDEEDRPRRKRKKVASSSKLLLLIGGVVAFVLLLCGTGGYFAFKSIRGNSDPAKANWTAFSAPDGSFSTSFPGGPPTQGDLFDYLTSNNKAEMDQDRRDLAAAGVQTPAWQYKDAVRRYVVGYMLFPPLIADAAKPEVMLDEVSKQTRQGTKDGNETIILSETTTFVGKPAKKILIEARGGIANLRQALIIVAIKGRVYFILSEGISITYDDAMTKAFFDKFIMNEQPVAPSGRRGR
jgi:ribosomal protein S27E